MSAVVFLPMKTGGGSFLKFGKEDAENPGLPISLWAANRYFEISDSPSASSATPA